MLDNFVNMLSQAVSRLIYYVPVLIISITVHEFCHARTAMRLGDDTAYNVGRVSLNPLRHLDPVGSICLVLFGFGWGKPVPISVLNFKNPKRDSALTALAGPASNLALACFWGLVFGIVSVFVSSQSYIFTFLFYSVYINCVLCVFNLLPVTPLDGSRVLSLILPDKWYWWLARNERYFFIGLMILMLIGVFSPVINFLAGGLYSGIGYTFIALGRLISGLFV